MRDGAGRMGGTGSQSNCSGVDPAWLRSVHLFEDVPETVLTDIASRLMTESVAADRTVLRL